MEFTLALMNPIPVVDPIPMVAPMEFRFRYLTIFFDPSPQSNYLLFSVHSVQNNICRVGKLFSMEPMSVKLRRSQRCPGDSLYNLVMPIT